MLDHRSLVRLIIVCGIALMFVSILYLTEPASALPDFFPGRQDGFNGHRPMYGIAAAILGYGTFAFAAFLPDFHGRRE